MTSDTSIFVGCVDDQTAWVRIEGVATKETSGCVRRYVTEKFASGLRHFIIDMEMCRLIDSTFIGILTGLAGKIADAGDKGEVELIRTNERNAKSICKLGLDNLIKIHKEGCKCSAEELEEQVQSSLDRLETEDQDKSEKSRMILKAHEDLCSANDENTEEFKDVLHFLRKDAEESSNS